MNTSHKNNHTQKTTPVLSATATISTSPTTSSTTILTLSMAPKYTAPKVVAIKRETVKKTMYGFTLIELLITMAICIILGCMAAPSLMSFHQQQSANTVTSEIRRTLSVARQYAVDTQTTVTLCGINVDNTCTKNDIRNLIIFIDTNTNKIWDNNETLIINRELTNSGNIRLIASFGVKHIQFRGNGSAKQAGSFIYCVKNQPQLSRRVTLSLVGRAYKARARSSDGIVTLTSGKDITC